MAESATAIVGKCRSGSRHWWTVHGFVGLKSPVCGHCYVRNPFFTEEDARNYDSAMRHYGVTAASRIERAEARRAELGWD